MDDGCVYDIGKRIEWKKKTVDGASDTIRETRKKGRQVRIKEGKKKEGMKERGRWWKQKNEEGGSIERKKEEERKKEDNRMDKNLTGRIRKRYK